MRRFTSFLKAVFLIALLIISAFLLWVSDKHVIPIVMYHSIGSVQESATDAVSVEVYKRQIEFLDKYDYNVISLDELIEGKKQGEKFPRNTVVLTFDDGLENNYTNAFGVLRDKGFSATFFIPFEDIDEDGHLTTEQIKEMLSAGMLLGSHTMTHAYLPKLSFIEQETEIVDSKRNLEKKFGVEVTTFAYPVGGFMEESKKIVQNAGYKAAVTTNRGFDPMNHDLFELNRVKLSNRDNNDFLIFWKLTGYYTTFKSRKNPY